jgi:hypothetical protein
MSPELARNLISTTGWFLLVVIAILPLFLHWKYGFGKPKYLRRIGEYLALRGFTLTAGKRSPTANILHDGALYTIRYHDSLGREYEAVASVTPIAGVFIGEQKVLSPQEISLPVQAPEDHQPRMGTPTNTTPLAAEVELQKLLDLQEENRRLKHLLATLHDTHKHKRNSTVS